MEKVVVIVRSPEFTSKDYDKVWDGVRAAGHSNPKGLLSHVSFEDPEEGWTIIDVWESADAFKEYGKILMPIIERTGKKLPEPKIIPAHFFYQAQAEPQQA